MKKLAIIVSLMLAALSAGCAVTSATAAEVGLSAGRNIQKQDVTRLSVSQNVLGLDATVSLDHAQNGYSSFDKGVDTVAATAWAGINAGPFKVGGFVGPAYVKSVEDSTFGIVYGANAKYTLTKSVDFVVDVRRFNASKSSTYQSTALTAGLNFKF